MTAAVEVLYEVEAALKCQDGSSTEKEFSNGLTLEEVADEIVTSYVQPEHQTPVRQYK
uniref:Uncharacterized protein n=1 Tax=Amphimedon queenslandica TaxID=400682 RepID=A0A1X7VK30_AMPQE